MSNVGKPERVTQNRVIALFRDELGYQYLGDWSDRFGNSNIEEDLLTKNLEDRNYTAPQITAALNKLRADADNSNCRLYDNNLAVYKLMRYGVPVVTEAGGLNETVHLIDWKNPARNHFAIAEEVTLKGNHERRPDIVLYVNGLAIGVLELKNSRVSLGEGIRQNLSNQTPEFNEWFFSTVQFLFAGNDSEGLKYGAIKTEEKYYLRWKENEEENVDYKLDKYLAKMCAKERLIELMRDFTLFDGGVKKLPRVHQYFAVKAAQEHVRNYENGIIWHTQGSGKSIVMVLLAQWILENNPDARVAIITDRKELDRQIEGVFRNAGEEIKRTRSGRDLMNDLGQPLPRLLCSLVHKFGVRDVDDFEEYIKGLEQGPSKIHGDVFIFVDECHRTQSGKLHRAMKAVMPNAVFIGFTGTPLLKQDRQTSLEVFGRYIHTYKFNEAVEDEVILDLLYEARDVDQKLSSQDKIDQWFDVKTRGLNDWQRDELKNKWGTMQALLSSRSRMEEIACDINFDFNIKPRLKSEKGNAILVAKSIFEACKYYRIFQNMNAQLTDRCGLVTSYSPQAGDVSKEEIGAKTETDMQFVYNTYADLLKNAEETMGVSGAAAYEERAKEMFIKEPANMKLLIVVDKLLTGFDAPPCTCLYIDKSMRDHGLFQAICRANRLDGDDKDFGYIVDYMDMFKRVENAIAVYASDELDHTAGGADPNVLLLDRLKKGRERLDAAFETLELLCEGVAPPAADLDHIRYFCGNTEISSDLDERGHLRGEMYKAAASLVRAYGNIADEFRSAGYSDGEVDSLEKRMKHFVNVRDIIKKASGETLDLKPYEADMRYLIDTYIEAEGARKVSSFGDMGLLEVIVKTGIADAIASELAEIKDNKDAVAEAIENNVRRKIIKEHLNDPAFYDKMSELLDEVIANRKVKALAYEDYLKKIAALVKTAEAGMPDDAPEQLDTPGKRALYNNLGSDEKLALNLDRVVKAARPDGWRGDQAKERLIKQEMYTVLKDEDEVERMFAIVKAQKEYQ